EGGSHEQGEGGGGQQRIPEGQQTGKQVEKAAQPPEERMAPALRLEGMEELQGAADQHHDAEIDDRCDGGRKKIEEGHQAEDEKQDAERQEPAPLVPYLIRLRCFRSKSHAYSPALITGRS